MPPDAPTTARPAVTALAPSPVPQPQRFWYGIDVMDPANSRPGEIELLAQQNQQYNQFQVGRGGRGRAGQGLAPVPRCA